MSENKTLEEEILIITCRGIEEADKIRGEFTHTDDIDRNLNALAQRMTDSILSLVVAKLEGLEKGARYIDSPEAIQYNNEKYLEAQIYNTAIADCIQAIISRTKKV